MTKITRRKFIALSTLPLLGGAIPYQMSLPQAQSLDFGLPYAGSPGLDTWYIRQWYGNTRWAYRQRRALYSAGQGLHFGVDFFAPCGAPVVAIADGTVAAVDGPYGAAPHNLVIRHANGLASLYGHLQERASLRIGQTVKKGQVVAVTGAPTGADCDTHPHLHLEIRTADLGGTVNPVPLIKAEWHKLTLGLLGEGTAFEVDLENPQRWQNPFDQPTVRFGGAILNNYTRSWPGQS